MVAQGAMLMDIMLNADFVVYRPSQIATLHLQHQCQAQPQPRPQHLHLHLPLVPIQLKSI